MPKISNDKLYPPDTVYNDKDSFVGTDANDNKKTKTYYMDGLLAYIMLNYGGTEQNNIIIRRHYKTTTIPGDIVADINTKGLTIAANEIALVSNYVRPASGGSYLAMYIINTGKGTYNTSNPLTWNSLTMLAPMFVTTELQTAEGETIDLGDIGSDTIEDHINALVGTDYDLLENVIYFFTTIEEDVPKTYVWLGETPLTIGDGGTVVTADDFDLIAVNGENVNTSIITKVSQLENDVPYLTFADLVNGIIDVSAIWVSGLSFDVKADYYPINNEFYSSTADTVTLDASHATLDRIDLIVAIKPIDPETIGTVGKITGTPATSELIVPPDYDPSLYFVIKQVIVRALATEPEGVSTTVVYDEGIEWTVATTANISETANDPSNGVNSLEAVDFVTTDFIRFTAPSPISTALIDAVTLKLKLKAPTTFGFLDFYFYLGTDLVKRYFLFHNNNTNGFNGNNTEYQTLTILKSDLKLPVGNIDNFTFKVHASGDGYFVDEVKIHTGSGSDVNGSIKRTSQLINDADDGENTFLSTKQKTYTGAFTLSNSDHGYLIWLNSASAFNITVNNSLRDNFQCEFYNIGAGTVTFVAGTGTIDTPDGTDLATDKVCMLIKRLNNNDYKVKGELI